MDGIEECLCELEARKEVSEISEDIIFLELETIPSHFGSDAVSGCS